MRVRETVLTAFVLVTVPTVSVFGALLAINEHDAGCAVVAAMYAIGTVLLWRTARIERWSR